MASDCGGRNRPGQQLIVESVDLATRQLTNRHISEGGDEHVMDASPCRINGVRRTATGLGVTQPVLEHGRQGRRRASGRMLIEVGQDRLDLLLRRRASLGLDRGREHPRLARDRVDSTAHPPAPRPAARRTFVQRSDTLWTP